MLGDEQREEPKPQHASVDFDKFSKLLDNFRGSTREYLAYCSKAFDSASDLNKQLFSFHERLLLIDLGTIGLSVTALTSVASRAATIGWRKYLFVVLVGVAWGALLMSAFLCRAIMNDYLAANRKLYNEWLANALELTGGSVANDLRRISLAFTGTLKFEGEPIDAAALFNKGSAEIQDKLDDAKRLHLENTSKTGVAKEGMSTCTASVHAIRYMQYALVLLALAAFVLVISL